MLRPRPIVTRSETSAIAPAKGAGKLHKKIGMDAWPGATKEHTVPIDIDDNLVNAAIIEFHTAKDHGKTEAQCWAAAVARVRYDVLTIGSLTCERVAEGFMNESDAEAEAAHSCARAIRDLY